MTVRWAVLEAVTAGLCGPSPAPSLLAEGHAMLSAVLEDLSAIDGAVVATVDNESRECWQQLCADSDAAIVIAPETDGLLAELVDEAGRHPQLRVWNATPDAIRLATDKFAFARHLERHGVPTIPTALETWTEPPDAYPCVVKPRDGAGSWLVRRVGDASMWQRVHAEYQAAASLSGSRTPVSGGEGTEPKAQGLHAIRQPFLTGRNLSIAGWFHDDGVHWLPIAEQRLSNDGQFRYLGGRIPAALTDAEAAAIHALVQAAAATISGLRGYIGFDVLQSDDTPREPLIVELNPRLTTSYVGSRAWCGQNLLSRWLTSVGGSVPANERPLGIRAAITEQVGTTHPINAIEFDADGTVRGISST